MASNQINTRNIAGGAWVGVKVNGNLVALVSNASYQEDFAVQPANVLNYLGPISYDSQSYSCNLTLGLLVARDKQEIFQLIPTRDKVSRDGKIPTNEIEFIDSADNIILESFSGCVISSHGTNVVPNAYVTKDMQLMCIKRNDPDNVADIGEGGAGANGIV